MEVDTEIDLNAIYLSTHLHSSAYLHGKRKEISLDELSYMIIIWLYNCGASGWVSLESGGHTEWETWAGVDISAFEIKFLSFSEKLCLFLSPSTIGGGPPT